MCSHNLGRSLLLVAAIHHRHHALGEAEEGLTRDSIHLGSSWSTIIATLTDTLYDRNLGEQWHIHLLRQVLATLLAKDIILVLWQLGWREVSHVLYQSEDRHVHLVILIHVDTLASIGESHLLRRTHDDSTRDGKRLQKRQVDVAAS